MTEEATKNRGGRRSWVLPEERMVGKNVALTPRHIAWLEETATARRCPQSLLVREAIDLMMGAGAGKTEAALLGMRASALAEEGVRRAEGLVREAYQEGQHLARLMAEALYAKLLALDAVKQQIKEGTNDGE
jgi:hypothetical protein